MQGVTTAGGGTMAYARNLLSGVVAGLAVVATTIPAVAAGSGPLNTPLDSFTDGTIGKYLWTVVGVVKKNGFVTEFMCTNLDAPGGMANIGVEIFDNTGTQLNNISSPPPAGGCNGALLNVPAGNTVTFSNGATVQFHEDCIMGIAAFDNGSARIVSTSSKIVCNALVADSKNVVVNSSGVTTGVSPAVSSLKMIKRSKQLGD